MKGTVTKVGELTQSKYNGHAYRMICFQLDDGKSAITYVDIKMHNVINWQKIIKSGVGTYVDGLKLKKKGLVSADSKPIII